MRHTITVTTLELQAIVQAVHKDRGYSPNANILRPTERDDLVRQLRAELADTESNTEELSA